MSQHHLTSINRLSQI